MRHTFVFLLILLSAQVSAAPSVERVAQAISTPINSLDPFRLSGLDAFVVTANVLEPLAYAHPVTKTLKPCLAKSWVVNLQRGTIVVKLREGVYFHNGQRLTADDVKFTFESFRKPIPERAVWRAMWQDIESVRVMDPQTVEFKMKGRHYLAFQSLMISMRILPKSFYGEAPEERFRTEMVGSGPFRLKKFTPGSFLMLAPYERWWGPVKPSFNLLVKSVEDLKSAVALVGKGEVDVYALPSIADQILISESEKLGVSIQSNKASMGEGLWIDLNLRRPVFQSREVRRALMLLWDRSSTSKKLYGGRYKLALDSFSPNMVYYPKAEAERFDLARANELLRQAGWVDSNQDGVLDRVIDGKRVDLNFQILVNSAESERWVSLYQLDAAKAGVRVTLLRVEETSQYWQLLKEGRFDAVAGGGGLSESVHVSSWKTNAPYNFVGYHNEKVDELLVRIDGEFDLKKRQAIETRLIHLVRDDVAQIPGLVSSEEAFLLSKRVQVNGESPLQAWLWRLKH